MLIYNIIWGWICWATFWSYAFKHLSRIYLQYNDKRFNLLLFRINTFSLYYSFFWVRIRYSLYSSTGFCSIIFWLYKRWIRFTLILPNFINKLDRGGVFLPNWFKGIPSLSSIFAIHTRLRRRKIGNFLASVWSGSCLILTLLLRKRIKININYLVLSLIRAKQVSKC